jgi:hypothetical protein
MGRFLELARLAMRDRWAKRAAALLAQILDTDARVELRYWFEERAAVFEFDGGMDREAAEEQAYRLLLAEVHRDR